MKGSSRRGFLKKAAMAEENVSVNKKRISGYLLLGIVPFMLAAGKIISSSVVNWDKVSAVKSHTGWTRNMLKSPTRSLDLLEIQAFTLYPGKVTHTYLVDKQNDELFIVKEGTADISINNETKHLIEGDLAVAFQENRVTISNKGSSNLVYYSIRFKPRTVKPVAKPSKKYKSLYARIDTIKTIKTPDGVRRNISNKATSSLRNLDIHLATIKSDFNGLEPDTHSEEEIVLVRKGVIFGSLKGKPYQLGEGSLLFLSNEDPVEISNGGDSQCEYYVIRWQTWNPEPKK